MPLQQPLGQHRSGPGLPEWLCGASPGHGGNDTTQIHHLLREGAEEYTAKDVLDYLLGEK
jgi:hypothetical protein